MSDENSVRIKFGPNAQITEEAIVYAKAIAETMLMQVVRHNGKIVVVTNISLTPETGLKLFIKEVTDQTTLKHCEQLTDLSDISNFPSVEYQL